MPDLEILATFSTSEAHRDLFVKGHLVEEWSRSYPMLFDTQDVQIALNQRHLGYHYYEWLAAILIYHTKGFLSLIEAYAYQSHKQKRKILETLVTGEALDFIASRGISSVTQCPDLLVYEPYNKEWFFCEVKGPRDHLRKTQLLLFNDLTKATGKDVKIVQFKIADEINPT